MFNGQFRISENLMYAYGKKIAKITFANGIH